MIQFRMPNGDVEIVPPEIQGAGDTAVQGFYDGQAMRVAMQLGISVTELHSAEYAANPVTFVAAVKAAAELVSAPADASTGA